MNDLSKHDLSVIIVSYEIRSLLKDCLKSVFAQTKGILFEVIVVDNNSTDESADMVEKEFPQVKLIRNKENLGFAKANNIAIRQSDARYVLLLNPDTIILDGALQKMVTFMDEHPDAGAVGPAVLNPDGSIQPSAFNHFTSLKWVSLGGFLFQKIIPKLRAFFHNSHFRKEKEKRKGIQEMDWVGGCCMMLNVLLLKKNLFLNDKYFFNQDDVDLCYRIKKNGRKVYFLPQAEIVHFKGQSSKKEKDVFIHSIQGVYVFFQDHYGRTYALCYRVILFMESILRIAKILLYERLGKTKGDYESLHRWVKTLRWTIEVEKYLKRDNGYTREKDDLVFKKPKVYYAGRRITQERTGGEKYYKGVFRFLEQNCQFHYWDYGMSVKTIRGPKPFRYIVNFLIITGWCVRQLKRHTKKGEVIFINSYFERFYFGFAWIAKFIYRRKLLLTVNGLYFYCRTPIQNYFNRLSLKLFLVVADIIVVNSGGMKKALTSLGISERKIRIIRPQLGSAPMKNLYLQKKIIGHAFHILFVGYCDPYKEIHVLISAVGKLKAIPIRLHIVGGIWDLKYYQKLRRSIEILEVEEKTRFYGDLRGENLTGQYKKAHILIVPGRGEGYGRVVVEAMSFGVPVIGARESGVSDIVTDGMNGFLFNGGAANDLAAKILTLYTNRNLYYKMSKQSLRVKEKVNFNHDIGEDFYEIIRAMYLEII